MVEFLTTSMFAPAKRDEHGNDVTASEQYQEKLKAYQTWFKGIGLHATLYCRACMTISWENLSVVPLLRTCGTYLRFGSVRHPLQGYVPCA